jgi:Fic family protein
MLYLLSKQNKLILRKKRYQLMEKKITKKEMFLQVIALVQGEEISVSLDEIMEFARHEIDLLNKKANSKSKKEKANDAENNRLSDLILEVLLDSKKAFTISEIMAENSELGALSNQKVSALMKKLVDGGLVVKSVNKGRSYFSA